MAALPSKSSIIELLVQAIARDLDAISESQKRMQEGATHEESRAENDKDTRATETSYLARGLAKRVEELRTTRAQLSSLKLRDYGDEDDIGLSALITVEDDDGDAAYYFLVPSGGGRKVEFAGVTITTVTPQSPLGAALVGRQVDDEVRVQRPQGRASLVICDVR